MRVKYDKKTRTYIYSYSGDLQKEVDKCFGELKNKEQFLTLLVAIYEKAKKEKESCEKRIENLKGFLKTVKDKKGVVPSLEEQ